MGFVEWSFLILFAGLGIAFRLFLRGYIKLRAWQILLVAACFVIESIIEFFDLSRWEQEGGYHVFGRFERTLYDAGGKWLVSAFGVGIAAVIVWRLFAYLNVVARAESYGQDPEPVAPPKAPKKPSRPLEPVPPRAAAGPYRTAPGWSPPPAPSEVRPSATPQVSAQAEAVSQPKILR